MSIPSPVYQCINAWRLYIAVNYFIHIRSANSVMGLGERKHTWVRLRVNSSWIAVVFARQVADCFWPTGGTEHNVTDTLSGIHLFKCDVSPRLSTKNEGHNYSTKR